MKLQKRYLAFIGICLVLLMASCGQSQPENGSPKKDDKSSVKSEKEIIQDLSQNEDFYTLFDPDCYDINGNYLSSTYSIDELTITRRKINDGTGMDDVYVSIIASGPASNYIGDFHLIYSLYDVGGWYLENIELESGTFEVLSRVSETDIYSIALDILGSLGADASDLSIEGREMVSDQDEFVTARVDFNDGIIVVQGDIYLYFYYDGATWSHDDTIVDLNYDILADGTYKTYGGSGYPDYLVINHENGVPVIRRATTWGGGIDPFQIKDWDFDCLSRAYVYNIGTNGEIPCEYRFGNDGVIYHSAGGVQTQTLYRIADPITDASVLQKTLTESGIPWSRTG